MRFLSLILLVLLSNAGLLAQSSKPKESPFDRISSSVVVTGTVVTDIVTPGNDCHHKYWLALESEGGKETGNVGLRPESMDFGKYLGKRVRVKGSWGLCTGTEISIPFLSAVTVTPIK